MSTRCQILVTDKEYDFEKGKVKFNEPLIYRHSDGYPEGVIPDIKPFIEWFLKERGFDCAYLTARLVQHLTNVYDFEGRAFHKEIGCKGEYAGVLGHGLDNCLHGDIEYLYVVTKASIKVYDVEQTYSEKGKYISTKFNLKKEEVFNA